MRIITTSCAIVVAVVCFTVLLSAIAEWAENGHITHDGMIWSAWKSAGMLICLVVIIVAVAPAARL